VAGISRLRHVRVGRELNETAREAGDDPNDWYVSETPIDVMKVSEFWSSRTVLNPRLQRSDSYIADIRRMVTMCRERDGVFSPKLASCIH
jgi:hypothetical protein